MKKRALHGLMRNNIGAYRTTVLLCITIIALFTACTESGRHEPLKPDSSKPSIPAPQFNADSAYRFIQKQVDFGPRIPNTPAHDSCAVFLKEKLKSFNLEVVTQKGEVTAYNGIKLNFENIIAAVNPSAPNKIILCGHWDTRPFADQDAIDNNTFDGANDGGSGTGVLLEIARLLGQTPPDIGVDLIFFDAEDYGKSNVENSYCLGSQYWAKNINRTNYYPKYGILLDMVGAPDATFAMEGYSMQYAPHIVKKVWKTAARQGYSDYFIFKKTGTVTDDHLYVNTIANIPCIDIIHYDPATRSGFGSYWHTQNDNMESVDKNTLKAVGQTLLEVIYSE